MITPATRTLPTPIGELTIVAGSGGIRAVTFPGERTASGATPGDQQPEASNAAEELRAEDHLQRAVIQLLEYFAGTRQAFELALDPHGTAFQLRAWEVLRTIPFGRTMSYGEQAEALGSPSSARAVGAANGRNPIPIIVPCHRVVGASGALTGFTGGLQTKAWLLDHERRIRDGR